MKPELSIIIPFFNRKSYLREAVSSILSAGESRWEIVAVDDGSTDGGAQEIADLPLEIITSRRNGGPGHARNLGLSHARAELIYFFDSDDVLVPEPLKWLISQIQRHSDWFAVAGKFDSLIDKTGAKINGPEVEHYCHRPRPERLTFADYAYGTGISGGLQLFLFRRSILDRVGPLDETLRCSDDRELLLRVLRHCSIPLFDCPLVKRRVHDSNLAVQLDPDGKFELKNIVKATNRLVDLGLVDEPVA